MRTLDTVCDFDPFAPGFSTGRRRANFVVSVMSSSILNRIGPIFFALGKGCGYNESSH